MKNSFGRAEAYGENKMEKEERPRQNRSLSLLFTFHFSFFTFHLSLKKHLLPSFYIYAWMGDVVDALSLEIIDRGIGWSEGDGWDVQ